MKIGHILVIFSVFYVLSACAPSEESIQATVDAKLRDAIAAIPSATSQPTVTPQPSATPITLPTPLPTATPVNFPTPLPTSTPFPTATPVRFPTPLPTATPLILPPTPTPSGFPTPLPTPTPFGSTGAQATPTPFRFLGYWPSIRIENVGIGLGNGVLISENEILTAYHVVRGGNQILVTLPAAVGVTETRKAATIIGFNSSNDLALLSIGTSFGVSGIDFPAIVSATDQRCTTGQRTMTSNGDELVMETTGNDVQTIAIYRVWGKRSIGVGNFKYLTDLGGVPGLSGGPIYTVTGRTLAGIIQQRDLGLSSITPIIAIDGCQIANLLPSLRSGGGS